MNQPIIPELRDEALLSNPGSKQSSERVQKWVDQTRPQEVQDEIRAEDSVSVAGGQQQPQGKNEQQQVEARQRRQEIHERALQAQQTAQARMRKQAEYMYEKDGRDRFPRSPVKTTRDPEALAEKRHDEKWSTITRKRDKIHESRRAMQQQRPYSPIMTEDQRTISHGYKQYPDQQLQEPVRTWNVYDALRDLEDEPQDEIQDDQQLQDDEPQGDQQLQDEDEEMETETAVRRSRSTGYARSARISTQARGSRLDRSRSDRSRSGHGGREISGRGGQLPEKSRE